MYFDQTKNFCFIKHMPKMSGYPNKSCFVIAVPLPFSSPFNSKHKNAFIIYSAFSKLGKCLSILKLIRNYTLINKKIFHDERNITFKYLKHDFCLCKSFSDSNLRKMIIIRHVFIQTKFCMWGGEGTKFSFA